MICRDRLPGKYVQKLTHVYDRVYLKYFSHSLMQRANLLDWLQNLQVVAALRSAMLIFFYKFSMSGDLVQSWCWYVAECFNYDPGIWLILRVRGGP